MADRFVDYSEDTPVCADWLNQVDRSVYNALGASDTPGQLRTFLGVLGEAPIDGSKYARQNGGWAVVEVGGEPVGDAVVTAPSGTQNTITQTLATDYPLRIKTNAGVDAAFHVLEVLDASDGVRAFVNANGSFNAGFGYDRLDDTPETTAVLSNSGFVVAVGPGSRSVRGPQYGLIRAAPSAGGDPNAGVGIVVRNDNGATDNMMEFQSNTGAIMSFVGADGAIYAGTNVNPGQAKLAGGSNARVNITKYASNTLQQLLCEADYEGDLRELWYNDSRGGTDLGNGMESSLRLSRAWVTGDNDLTLNSLAELRSFTGASSASGRIVLGHGKFTGADKGYWHFLPWVNNTPYEFWMTHGTSETGINTPILKLRSDGDILVTRDVYANGVKLTSDIALKTDVTSAPRYLDKLNALEPICFRWKSDEAGPTEVGFSAQEVQKVLPDLVHDAGDHLTLAITNMIPMLVSAVQELTQRLEAVEAA